MSIVNEIITVNVARNSVFPSRAGFGVANFVAYHTLWPQRVRQFSSAAEVQAAVLAGGGTLAHPGAVAGNLAFSQKVTPKKFVVGRRALPFTQTVTLTVVDATAGTVYDFDIVDATGTVNQILYTVPAAQTTTQVAAALELLIEAVPGIASTATAAVITCVTDVGLLVNYARLPARNKLLFADTTTDPGIATDLTAIELETATSVGIEWYGFSLDSCSKAQFAAASTWVQSRTKVFAGRQTDSEVSDSGDTDDAFSAAVAASKDRMVMLFAKGSSNDYRDLALLAACLPEEPGSYTVALKSLVGITIDTLDPSERSAVLAKRGTVYEGGSGINVTFEGKTPKNGGWFDQVVASDFVAARCKEDFLAYLASSKIVPYDQAGIDSCLMVFQARVDKCTKAPNKIFSLDVPPVVNPIAIADTEASDRDARRLTGITITARFSGAIHGGDVVINVGV